MCPEPAITFLVYCNLLGCQMYTAPAQTVWPVMFCAHNFLPRPDPRAMDWIAIPFDHGVLK